jgi:hypothetical protein
MLFLASLCLILQYSTELKDLIVRLLASDPSSRPDSSDILAVCWRSLYTASLHSSHFLPILPSTSTKSSTGLRVQTPSVRDPAYHVRVWVLLPFSYCMQPHQKHPNVLCLPQRKAQFLCGAQDNLHNLSKPLRVCVFDYLLLLMERRQSSTHGLYQWSQFFGYCFCC